MNTLIEALNLWGPRFTGFALPALVQSSILIALLLALETVLRQRVRATVRHGLWLLVLVKLVLPTSLASPASVAYWLPASTSAPARIALPAPVILPDPVVRQPTPGPAFVVPPAQPVQRVATLTRPALGLLAWLAGMASLTGLLLWRCASVRRMLARSTEAPSQTTALLESCRQQMGLRRRVALRCTAVLGSPAICGLFRPVIVLPAALPSRLAPAELRSVLLHELAHFKRGDLWLRHAQILLQVFYWYNPLLWLANAIIRRLREQAVDEMVLVEMREEAPAYPATLLQVARLMLQRPTLGLGLLGILESRNALAQRIRQIVDRPLPRSATLGIRGLLLVGLVGLLVLPMAGPRQTVAAEAVPPATPDSPPPATAPERLSPPAVPAPPSPQRPVFPERYGAPRPGMEMRVPRMMMPPGYVPPNNFMAGMMLSTEDAEALEAKLAKTPDDLAMREQLLGYYHHAGPFSVRAQTGQVTNALWVIEHHPEAYSPIYENIMRFRNDEAFGQASALWLKHVKANPTKAAILAHAAGYAPLPDGQTAETLLKQALALEPKNPDYMNSLARCYSSHAGTGDTTEKKALAQKALGLLEEAQANTSSEQVKFYNLRDLAQVAMAADELRKARTYARSLLEKSEVAEEKHWGGTDAVSKGHMILGRIALREADLSEARKQLLEAVDITSETARGSLSTSGPNLLLAKELLDKGEKDTVLEFFKRCREFWTFGKEKLDAWSWQVSQGETPDFGVNLMY